MADLNELSEFEKQLKNLIENRNNFKPEYVDINAPPKPKVWSEQEKKYMDKMAKMGMFMGIPEHGRPYRSEDATYMLVPEHGQPFRTEIVTHMAVPEHGNPYEWDGLTLMCVPEHGRPMFATRMAIGEHGQPYKTPRLRTKMAIGEHGRPFKSGATTFISTNMVVREHGQPYRTAKEEHDYMKSTCFDYCPTFAGQKCGRPGCS